MSKLVSTLQKKISKKLRYLLDGNIYLLIHFLFNHKANIIGTKNSNLPKNCLSLLALKAITLIILFTSNIKPVFSEGTGDYRPDYYKDNGYTGGSLGWPENNKEWLSIDDSKNKYFTIKDSSEKVYFGFGYFSTQNISRYNQNLTSSHIKDMTYRILDKDSNIVMQGPVPVGSGQGFIGDHTEASYNRCTKGPQQLVAGGYNALEFDPAKSGEYCLQIKNNDDNNKMHHSQLFDLTVSDKNGNAIEGRLWSKQWFFLAYHGLSGSFEAQFYSYSIDDGVVTSFEFYDFRPYGFNIMCNNFGIDSTKPSRISAMSTESSSFKKIDAVAQHKLFLNPPDEEVFPTLGLNCVNTNSVTRQCNSNKYKIELSSSKNGFANILIDFNKNGEFDVDTRDILYSTVKVRKGSDNYVTWDGIDGLGDTVPYNDTIDIYAYTISGVNHLPLNDVENNGGFSINLLRPHLDCNGDSLKKPLLYWDDRNVKDNNGNLGSSNYKGCEGVCHSWSNTNNLLHNTWWYIINNKTHAQFITRDTALLFEFNPLNNEEGYYKDGDSIAMDIYFRSDEYNATEILNGITLIPYYGVDYTFTKIAADSFTVNDYTGGMKAYWKVNIPSTDTIPGIMFFNDYSVNTCNGRNPFIINAKLKGKTRVKQNVSCYGGSDGIIEVFDQQGGYGVFDYSIDSGKTWIRIAELKNIKAGTYEVWIRDRVNKKDIEIIDSSITITQPPEFLYSMEANGDPAPESIQICPYDSIFLEGLKGTNTTKIEWLNASGDLINSEKLYANENGTYYLIAYDSNSCADSSSIKILHHDIPEIKFDTPNNDSVYNGQQGVQYSLDPNNGHIYNWDASPYGSVISQNNSLANINWGWDTTSSARVRVKDSSTVTGCISQNSFKVKIYRPLPLEVYYKLIINESCEDKEDGKIVVAVKGGKENINFDLFDINNNPIPGTIQQPDTFVVSGLSFGNYILKVTNPYVDDLVDTFEIGYKPEINYSLNTKHADICEGESFYFEVKGDSLKAFTWFNGSGDSLSNQRTLKANSAGDYFVDIVDYHDCSKNDSIELAVHEKPELEFTQFEDSVYTNKQNVSYSAFSKGVINYSWMFSNSFGKLDVLLDNSKAEIDFYSSAINKAPLIVIGEDIISGCKDTLIKNITIYNPPPLSITKEITDETCPGDKDGEIFIKATGGEEDTYINVYNERGEALKGNEKIGNPSTINITGLSAGNYSLKVFNSFAPNSPVTKTFVIAYKNKAYPEIIENNILCLSDTALFEVRHSGITSSRWYNSDNEVVEESNSLTTTTPGNYKLYIEYNGFCPDTFGFKVKAPDSVQYKLKVFEDAYCPDLCDGILELTKDAKTNNPAIIIMPSGKDSIIMYSGGYIEDLCAGKYNLKVRNNNCNNDSVALGVENLDCTHIPNAITPNGDGVHDYWDLRKTAELYPNMIVQIFNRWGKLVYESGKGYPNPFRGKHNGHFLPSNTYHYIIMLEGKSDGKYRSGQLTILY